MYRGYSWRSWVLDGDFGYLLEMLERYSPWIIECLVPEMEWETSEARKNHWNGRMLRPPGCEGKPCTELLQFVVEGFPLKVLSKNPQWISICAGAHLINLFNRFPFTQRCTCQLPVTFLWVFYRFFFAKFRADVVTLEGLVPGPEVLSLRRSYCSDGGVPCVPCRSWSEISWDFNGFDMCFDMFW